MKRKRTLTWTLTLSLLGAMRAVGAEPASTERPPLPYARDPYPSTYQPLPRHDTLLTGATILDGTGKLLRETDVLMSEGKIAAVGAGLTPPPEATVIDARGKWITPGIVDVHTHLGNFSVPYTAADIKHSDVNEGTDPNTAHVSAEHAVAAQDPSFSRVLAGGVTTAHVMPGSSNLFGGRTVVLKTVPATTMQAMKFPAAPPGFKMACGENPKAKYGGADRFPASRMGNVAGYREALAKAREHLRKWQAYQRGDSAEPPPADPRLDALAALLDGDLRVHIHCYRADDMAILLDLAREFGVRITAFHHAVEAYKIAALLARENVCSVVWSDWWGFKREAFDAIRENAAYLSAAGACVTLHSDSSSVGQRLTTEAAKAMAAGRRAGVPVAPELAITWITSVPAAVLGLEERIGALEAGKNADVVLWSGDPFSIYTRAEQVFIDGALVYDTRENGRRPRADFEIGQPVSGGGT